jgi:DNA-directed RNA polymerase subunit H (RpoH/RPB5)
MQQATSLTMTHYRAVQGIHARFAARGYTHVQPLPDATLAAFVARIHAAVAVTAKNDATRLPSHEEWCRALEMTAKTRGGHSVLVEWSPLPKVNIDTARALVKRMEAGGIMRAILVADDGLTPKAATTIREVERGRVEVFSVHTATVRLMDNVQMPLHRRLTAVEGTEIRRRFAMTDTLFPEILVTDPVCAYMDLRRGDLVEIVRHQAGVGSDLSYRVVRGGGATAIPLRN